MTKPRICFVIPSLGVGGTERQLVYLMKGLLERFEVMVICTVTDGAWAGDARRLGHVKVLGLRGGWDPRMQTRLRRMFKTYQPTVVHSFMFGFDYAVNRAARAAGVPVVVSSRRQRATWKKPRHIRLQRKANELVDAIVANARAVAEFAASQEGQTVERYTVIANGIDVEQFQTTLNPDSIKTRYKIPLDKRIVGIVANFSPVKDHALFVEMARELSSRREDLHFVMVGKGDGSETVGVKVREYGIDALITRFTTISELADVYRVMDVAVLTSQSEGFPNVVMEAMASGTPVVAANVGGVPELICDGQSGTLVDSRDPVSFADAVERYLDNEELAARVGDAACECIRASYSRNAMVTGYLELYDTLIRANTGD